MFLEKPIFHPLAQAAIDELARDGITPAPDEVVWIYHAAQKHLDTGRGREMSLDLPVQCGNATLWPPSLGAIEWLRGHRDWIAGEGNFQTFALAFILAHSRNPETLARLTSQATAIARMTAWALTLSATRREMDAAIVKCLGDEDIEFIETSGGPGRTQEARGYGDILALLCHHYPASPDYYLWQCSDAFLSSLISSIAKLTPAAAPRAEYSFASFAQFRAVIAAIRDAHKLKPDATQNG